MRKTLKINSDTTDELRSEYLGKKDGVFGENSIYNIVNENTIELVTPSSGEKTFGAVALSDSLRMLNSGELAKHYILKKQ
ncbi:copper resistance protein NlpE N-terminal domain-containing protein [Bacteroides fragilis]